MGITDKISLSVTEVYFCVSDKSYWCFSLGGKRGYYIVVAIRSSVVDWS